MAENAMDAGIVPKGYTPVYTKHWRTLILVPASIADEVRETLRAVEQTQNRTDRLEAAMKQVIAELEEDFDTVDGGDGQPAPNKAMRLASELKEAIYGPGGF